MFLTINDKTYFIFEFLAEHDWTLGPRSDELRRGFQTWVQYVHVNESGKQQRLW